MPTLSTVMTTRLLFLKTPDLKSLSEQLGEALKVISQPVKPASGS